MFEKTIKPTDSQMAALGKQLAGGGPVTMLNLLRYKEVADYSGHPDESMRTGREAYRKYIDVVKPCLESVGARIVFSGPITTTVVGPESEVWDDMLLIEYPTPQSLGEMRASSDYQRIEYHRTAGLEDTRVFAVGTGPMVFDT